MVEATTSENAHYTWRMEKKDETGCKVYVQQGEEKLTVREMAEKAGISEFTVRKRIKRGIYETASV